MKYLKRSIVVCLIFMMIIVLSGCGDNNTADNEVENNDVASEELDEKKSAEENNDVESIDFIELAKQQVSMPKEGETIAIMHVKGFGDIKIKFFDEVAPKAVENFITHSKNGYYNGLTFHRVINDFMIQGGDPTGTGAGGESIWKKSFEDEFSYSLAPYRGALCMANAGSNTNGSQFFIEQASYDKDTADMLIKYGYPDNLIEAYKKYGGSMHLFLAHTVFGQVIEGMDVVDKIANTETDGNNKPTEDVIIESIDIVQYHNN